MLIASLRRSSSLSAAIVACMLATAGIVHAQAYDPNADAAAQRAFEKGQAAFDHGRFDEAVKQFEQAYGLSHRPQVLFSIGRAADADGQSERALRAFEAYLQTQPDSQTRAYSEARVAKLRRTAPPPQSAPSSSMPNPWAAPAAAAAPAVVAAPPAAPQPGYYAPPPSSPYAAPYQTAASPTPVKPNPFQLYGGFRVGVGGSITESGEEDDSEYEEDTDLENTIGFQAGATYALPFFALGGEVRLNAMKIDGLSDRLKIWDFAFKPRARFELPTLPLEVYGALPVGLSVLQESESESNYVEKDLGANLGIMFGATYYVSEKVGINAEMGWQMHFFKNEEEDDYSDSTTYKTRVGQWTLLSTSIVFAP
jgi:hypothetical protein